MAAPNIVNVSTITGVTTFISGVSVLTPTIVLSNAAASNQVLKVNTLMAANTSTSGGTLTIKIFGAASGAGTSVSLGCTMTIPSGSSLAVIGKDTPIYLEENRSIGVIGVSTSFFDIVTSYEVIS